jgi:hypothetical protein
MVEKNCTTDEKVEKSRYFGAMRIKKSCNTYEIVGKFSGAWWIKKEL